MKYKLKAATDQEVYIVDFIHAPFSCTDVWGKLAAAPKPGNKKLNKDDLRQKSKSNK